MKSLLMALGLAAAASVAEAKLVFESVNVGVTADPKQHELKIDFPFACEGEAVTVSSVEASCGCISGAVDKKHLEPGEKGVVTATFKLGNFEGEIIKSIFLRSDDLENSNRQLTVRITIPKLISITPEVTSWGMGDAPTPKVVTVKVLDQKPIEVLSAVSGRENVTAEVREVEKGRHYEVVLTPKSTAAPMLGALTIKTNSDIPRYQSKMAFFNIVRPRATVPGASKTPAPAPAAEPKS